MIMEHSVTLPSGESLTLEPVRLGALPAFVRAVQPLAQQIASGTFDVLQALADHGERLQTALSLATGRPRAWVEALALDDAVVLAAAVIEVNAGFLQQHLLPAIAQAGAQVTPVLPASPSILTPPSATG